MNVSSGILGCATIPKETERQTIQPPLELLGFIIF